MKYYFICLLLTIMVTNTDYSINPINFQFSARYPKQANRDTSKGTKAKGGNESTQRSDNAVITYDDNNILI